MYVFNDPLVSTYMKYHANEASQSSLNFNISNVTYSIC